ncbi:hypothetical protein QBC45DRAFT_318193, partial [Copromyces sp. CBS 386.78]
AHITERPHISHQHRLPSSRLSCLVGTQVRSQGSREWIHNAVTVPQSAGCREAALGGA